MADQTNHTGDWVGFGVTCVLWIISSLTLSDLAMIATAFAGLTSGAYTIYKWTKNKKHD